MKRFLLTLLSMLIIISATACALKPNEQARQPGDKSPTKSDENVAKQHSPINKDKYKQLLTTSYEKYIKPLDLSDYDDLEDILINKKENEEERKKFMKNIEENINDSKVNLMAFKACIEGLKIDNKNLQELNDKLVKECDTLMDDIRAKEKELAKIDENMLKKSNKEISKFIKTNVDENIVEKSKFEDTLDQIEDILHINLDK